MHKFLWDFDIQTAHLILARRSDFIIITEKKKGKKKEKRELCRIVDFAVPPNHRLKLKESERKNKYLDLAKELKKLWNRKMTSMSIVMVLFVQYQRIIKWIGQVKTIHTTSLLRTTRILRRVLEI